MLRKVDKESAPQEFFKYFQTLIASQKAALAWQPDENNEKRSLYRVAIRAARKEEDLMRAESLERNRPFTLPLDQIFIYVESYRLLFKVAKVNIEDRKLSARLPMQLQILDDVGHKKILRALATLDPEKEEEILDYSKKKREVPEFERELYPELSSPDYGHDTPSEKPKQSDRDRSIFEQELSFVSLDEEDKLYADKRNAPRARPPEGKMVTMSNERAGKDGTYSLFDLSRGGLAVLVFEGKDYQSGDKVEIKAFDDQVLDEPMIAEVKSVREADDQGLQFKVGMQFV